VDLSIYKSRMCLFLLNKSTLCLRLCLDLCLHGNFIDNTSRILDNVLLQIIPFFDKLVRERRDI
jgi:hypothetical protein